MSYDNLQFLADQLRAAAPHAEWSASGVDRARELAAMLLRSGVRDLGLLSIQRVQVFRKIADWAPEEIEDGFAFTYDGGPLFGFLGTPDRHDREMVFQFDPTVGGHRVAWSAAGHGHVNYMLRAVSDGIAIVPVWGSSSDTANVRDFLVQGAALTLSFALPAAGINAGSALGKAIVTPAFAAAYPAATAAVGNAALAAAFNGGNIEAAAKSAILGTAGNAAGAAIGAQVTTATSLDVLGKVAASAVSNYISGNDVKRGIAMTLLDNAPRLAREGNAMEIPSFDITDPGAYATGDVAFDAFGADVSFAPLPMPSGSVQAIEPFNPWGSAMPTVPTLGPSPMPLPNYSGGSLLPSFDIFTPPFNPGAGYGMQPLPAPQSAGGGGSGNGWEVALQAIKAIAPTVISVIRGGQAPQPAPRMPGNPTVAASPSTWPVGVPVALPDGRIGVNFGNGQYSIADRNGQARTLPVSSPLPGAGIGSMFGGINATHLLIGAGLLGVVLMRRR